MQGGGEAGEEQERRAKVTSGEMHARTHTGKDQAAISNPPGSCRNIRERPAPAGHFSPSRHEASAERGWAEATGLPREEKRGGGQRAVGAHDEGKSGRREMGKCNPREKLRHRGHGRPTREKF